MEVYPKCPLCGESIVVSHKFIKGYMYQKCTCPNCRGYTMKVVVNVVAVNGEHWTEVK